MSDDTEAFFGWLAREAGTASVTSAEAEAILDVAREVAHNTERRYAPIATYALGLAAGAAEPAARLELAERVIAAVKAYEDG